MDEDNEEEVELQTSLDYRKKSQDIVTIDPTLSQQTNETTSSESLVRTAIRTVQFVIDNIKERLSHSSPFIQTARNVPNIGKSGTQ